MHFAGTSGSPHGKGYRLAADGTLVYTILEKAPSWIRMIHDSVDSALAAQGRKEMAREGNMGDEAAVCAGGRAQVPNTVVVEGCKA